MLNQSYDCLHSAHLHLRGRVLRPPESPQQDRPRGQIHVTSYGGNHYIVHIQCMSAAMEVIISTCTCSHIVHHVSSHGGKHAPHAHVHILSIMSAAIEVSMLHLHMFTYCPCQLSQEKMKSRSQVCDTERQRSWQSGSMDQWKRFNLKVLRP